MFFKVCSHCMMAVSVQFAKGFLARHSALKSRQSHEFFKSSDILKRLQE